MGEVPITQRITRTIRRHRKHILALFLMVWSILLISMLAYEVMHVARRAF